ncbi:hypothetical protein [Streptomyces sp. NBC_01530]|uniref:hypothetical protein n=1 Tax=Streptomyces sp. NBC_01530 TaxID=2903895 RepID=UPI003862D816
MASTLPRPADQEVSELARVDRRLHEDFGRDESMWLPQQWRDYFDEIAAVHAGYGWAAAS